MPRRRRVDRRRAPDPFVVMGELVAANQSGCAAFPPGRTVDEIYAVWSALPMPPRTDGWPWQAFQAGAARPCEMLTELDPFDAVEQPLGLICGEGELAGRCLFASEPGRGDTVIEAAARFAGTAVTG